MLPLQGLSAVELLHALTVSLILTGSTAWLLTSVAVVFLTIRDCLKDRKE